jgi:hypothetical protein
MDSISKLNIDRIDRIFWIFYFHHFPDESDETQSTLYGEGFKFSNHLFWCRQADCFCRIPQEAGKKRYPVNPVDPV